MYLSILYARTQKKRNFAFAFKNVYHHPRSEFAFSPTSPAADGSPNVSNFANFPGILHDLLARRELSPEQMRSVIDALMTGRLGDAEAAAFLVALRMKGETAREIASAALVLRQHMRRWEHGCAGVLDTCGTGGDGHATFNISTATAIVVAAAGVPVVKHGNRSVSSRSGSADVLAALGVRIDGDADFAQRSLRDTGFAFCFAPHFHPAMAHVGPIRKRLGVPTLFNCLGPLANPANAERQLLGVGRPELLDLLAGALAELGTNHALVVCGDDGLDEVTLTGTTHVRAIRDGMIHSFMWTPDDFGLAACKIRDLHADDANESAAIILRVLQGEPGPVRNIVVANVAAALLAAERTVSLREGVVVAEKALTSGDAYAVLEKLRAMTS